jgi:formate dehydrogenase maturation protein FdhE
LLGRFDETERAGWTGSSNMSSDDEEIRRCPKCGRPRASLMKRLGAKMRVYLQCLVCDADWAPAPTPPDESG